MARILEDHAWWNRQVANEDEELAAEGVEVASIADFRLMEEIAAL
jgi:hypothetical protein